ncbi:MAG: preprotein translocase subunit SecE, partial [Ignavibacteriaceae bacterium]
GWGFESLLTCRKLQNTMINKIKAFFNDVVKEMKKVTWPTKDELKESTTIVIVVCLIFAALTYVIDMAITQVFKGIF